MGTWYLIEIDISNMVNMHLIGAMFDNIDTVPPDMGYIDDFWRIYNTEILQAQGTFSPEVYSYGVTPEPKKLGSQSYLFPWDTMDDSIALAGLVYTVHAGDILKYYVYAEASWEGKTIVIVVWAQETAKAYYSILQTPPPPPPTFSPIWTKQIGTI